MLKNLHIKFLALLLATFFWIFVVSLQNAFFQIAEPVPVQVFNQSQELALASGLGTVKLTVRADDTAFVTKLSAKDFEAYVDLRNVGAGTHTLPISVTSKNADISVVRIEPDEIKVDLQPVRQKIVNLQLEVIGEVAKGFRLESAELEHKTVTVSGAQELLKTLGSAKVEIRLSGSENANFSREGSVKIFDKNGNVLESVIPQQKEVNVNFVIVEAESVKQLGVRARVIGSMHGAAVKSIEVEPAVLFVVGEREILNALEFIETEEIDLNGADKSFVSQAKIVLPEGVRLEEGQGSEVEVRVEVEAF